MLPFWFPKLILSLLGRNRCETGETDGVKGTILVWPVRIIEDQLIGHRICLSLGRPSTYLTLVQNDGQF
jgi:hypothetical protein